LKTFQRLVLSLGVAAALLLLLLAWGDLSLAEALGAWRVLPLATWFAVLGIHLWIYLFRTLRFAALLPVENVPRFPQLFAISSAHNMAAYVLPAKTGEASLVLYLKGLCGIAGPVGLAALLLSRLLDLLTVAASMTLVCGLLALTPRFEHLTWLGPLSLALAVTTAILFLLLRRGDRLVLLAVRPAGLLRTRAPRLAERLQSTATRVAEAVSHAGGEGRLLRGTLLSLPLWLGVYLYFAVLARGVGMPAEVTFPESVFGASLAVLSNLLPINGFAGFGTQDAGWVLGFGSLGVPRATALTTALGFHLVHLFNVVLLGLLGHLAMGLLSGKRAS
jgi:uncharacterized protein (TIRG00374 family)